MICGPLPKTFNTCGPCSSIKTLLFVLGFAISPKSYLKDLCSWPPENHSVDPNTGRGPRLRNPESGDIIVWNLSMFAWKLKFFVDVGVAETAWLARYWKILLQVLTNSFIIHSKTKSCQSEPFKSKYFCGLTSFTVSRVLHLERLNTLFGGTTLYLEYLPKTWFVRVECNFSHNKSKLCTTRYRRNNVKTTKFDRSEKIFAHNSDRC